MNTVTIIQTARDAATLIRRAGKQGGGRFLIVGGNATPIALRMRAQIKLDAEEQREVDAIHHAAGLLPADGRAPTPIRAPHHSISIKALMDPERGEVAIATGGVLYLDDALEMRQLAMEALARDEILKAPRVVILHGSACPCAAPSAKSCTCTPERREHHSYRLGWLAGAFRAETVRLSAGIDGEAIDAALRELDGGVRGD